MNLYINNMNFLNLSIYHLIWSILLLFSCSKEEDFVNDLERIEVLESVPPMAIIAHRGTCHWAPESTEAAFRWARQSGSTYLEFELQRTKDGYLVAFHDDYLWRTTDVYKKFPHIKNPSISNFTLEELLNLDLGSWFNNKYPSLARPSFIGLDILTLEDIIKIAEGWKIERDSHNKRISTRKDGKIITSYQKDPADNGNRPGIYPEIKNPELYPNIESDLKNELVRLGWYATQVSNLKNITTFPEHVNTANTSARVIIQTFSSKSLKKLNQTFPRLIPLCFLISIKENDIVNETIYNDWIEIALKNRAVIMGVCIPGSIPDNFGNLLEKWMYNLIKINKLLIHAYTFQSKEQIIKYKDFTDGFFTNQVNELLIELSLYNKIILNHNEITDGAKMLDILGY